MVQDEAAGRRKESPRDFPLIYGTKVAVSERWGNKAISQRACISDLRLRGPQGWVNAEALFLPFALSSRSHRAQRLLSSEETLRALSR